MKRFVFVITLLAVAIAYAQLSAQAPSDEAPPTSESPISADAKRPRDGLTIEDLLKDVPLKPVARTSATIEEVLKQTETITVRFNGHQMTLPVVSDVPLRDIAKVILNQIEQAPDLELHAGRTALLVQSPTDNVARVLNALVTEMFVQRGERPIITNSTSSDSVVHMPDGLPAKPIAAGDPVVEKVVLGAKDIYIPLGTYNIVVPLLDKSPRQRLAKSMMLLVHKQPAVQLLDGRQTLVVRTPKDQLVKVVVALREALSQGAQGDPKTTSAVNEPVDPPLAKPGKSDEVLLVQVYALRHVQADVLEKIFRQLFRDTVTIAADARANQLVVRAPGKLFDDIKEIINKMDQPGPQADVKGTKKTRPLSNAGPEREIVVDDDNPPSLQGDWTSYEWGKIKLNSVSPREYRGTYTGEYGNPGTYPSPGKIELKWSPDLHRYVGTWSRNAERFGRLSVRPSGDGSLRGAYTNDPESKAPTSSPELSDLQWLRVVDSKGASREGDLKKRYADLERQAADLARQGDNGPESLKEGLRAKLKTTVAEAFAVRQQLHQAELAAFQRRMESVRQTIQLREKIKDTIIDRRVSDLLNPDLKWDESPEAASPSTTKRVGPRDNAPVPYGKPITGSPIGLSGPPRAPGLRSIATELEGEWRQRHERYYPLIGIAEDPNDAVTIRVQGNVWVHTWNEFDSTFRIVVDAQANPKTIDLFDRSKEGRSDYVTKGIYRIEGDSLTFAWGKQSATRPKGFDEKEGAARVESWKRLDERDRRVQVHITSAKNSGLDRPYLSRLGHHTPTGMQYLPMRLEFEVGRTYRYELSSEGVAPQPVRLVSILVPRASESSARFLKHNAVPLQFSDEDLSQAEAGNLVTKVVYLPDPGQQKPSLPIPEVVVSTRLDPGVDPVLEAEKRGTILVVAKISSAPSPPTEVQPAQSTELSVFESAQSPSELIDAGIVKEVREDDRLIVISLAEPHECKVGDIWTVSRPEGAGADGNEMRRRFARVQVLEVQATPGVAVARVIESTRQRIGNEYSFESVKVGDTLGRPSRNSTATGRSSNSDAATVAKPDGRKILADISQFQEKFIRLERDDLAARQGLREALELQAAGEMGQDAFDGYQIRANQSKWRLESARAEFAAQIHLFDLELQSAVRALQLAEAEYFQAIKANSALPGTIAEAQIQKLKLALDAAKLDVDRATTVLDLYRQIAPPGEKVAEATFAPAEKHEAATVANLTTLMQGLRKYHDLHQRFPPAVIMGKDGKGQFPHSWRVAILPHIGKQQLYDRYHFDEPWDGAHNKSLLIEMPGVFRHPADHPVSTKASYFALVTPGFKANPAAAGPAAIGGAAGSSGDGAVLTAEPRYDLGTAFSNPLGAKMTDMHDGTSNTIMLVEAEREIPWLKPEDIPYAVDLPLPSLGGSPQGFHAGFADGTVKYLSAQNHKDVIRHLITIGDGHNVFPMLLDNKSRPIPAERQR